MSKSGSYVPQYPPNFADASSLPPALGKHIATQDFLQPLESRRSKEEVPGDRTVAIGVSGSADILQLSVRNNHKIEQPSSSKSSSWPGLGLRYPHPLDINSKTKHCHQNQNQPAEVLSKRSALPSDEEENDSDYNRKKPRKDLSTKNGDVKLTPRSKHSATEQRRRSKINDRFQMLRELLPQGDQKKDKASFLLEVIDYVKALQEKVRKYEAVEEKPFSKGNEIVEYKCPTPIATMNGGAFERSATPPPPPPPPPPPENSPQDQSQPSSSNQESGRPVVEVSAAYSQRLLETLTSAFKSSGIDLSQAHISVRLELGPTNTSATTTSKVTP